jgi:hypothetical protein
MLQRVRKKHSNERCALLTFDRNNLAMNEYQGPSQSPELVVGTRRRGTDLLTFTRCCAKTAATYREETTPNY